MKRKNLLLILLLVLFGRLSAQMITVSGRVVNSSGAEPLAGALVTLKGGTAKTLTGYLVMSDVYFRSEGDRYTDDG